MGLADILSAAARDYKPNLGWHQYIAGGPGAGAAADVGRYKRHRVSTKFLWGAL
jgi:hypothetical protein